MNEIIRRVVWLGLGLAAVWCFLAAAPWLWEVKPAPVVRDYERQYQPKTMFGMSGQMLDFMRRERRYLPPAEYLSGLVDGGGAVTADAALAAFLDRAVPVGPAEEEAVGGTDGALYFPLQESRLKRFREHGGEPVLVAANKDWFVDLWRVERVEPHRAPAAPPDLRYPRRHLAPWLALAAVAAYLFIPWPRREAQDIYYRRISSVWLPDWLGFALAAGAFALPVWMASSDGTTAQILDFAGSGMGWLTLVLWLLGACMLSLCGIGAWYGSVRVELLPDRVRRTNLLGVEEYPFALMREVRPIVQQLPRRLRMLMALGALANPRLAGALLLGSMNASTGIDVILGDGRRFKLWTNHLAGWERLEQALEARGLSLPESPDR
jgi:hypothetical protein